MTANIAISKGIYFRFGFVWWDRDRRSESTVVIPMRYYLLVLACVQDKDASRGSFGFIAQQTRSSLSLGVYFCIYVCVSVWVLRRCDKWMTKKLWETKTEHTRWCEDKVDAEEDARFAYICTILCMYGDLHENDLCMCVIILSCSILKLRSV